MKKTILIFQFVLISLFGFAQYAVETDSLIVYGGGTFGGVTVSPSMELIFITTTGTNEDLEINPNGTGELLLTDTRLTLNGTTDFFENTSGNSEITGSSIIFPTNIGTTLGSYNAIFGSGNFNAEEAPAYNFAAGYKNAYSATGSVFYNGIFGDRNAYSATGSVQYNGMFGYRNAYSATGSIVYNGIFGNQNAYSATGSVQYNGIFGRENAYSATGYVYYNGIFGRENAYSATGNVYNSLLIGYKNADSATTVTNTIAVGGEVFKNSKIDLTNAIGLGYQAGINTTYTGAAIFGTQGQPTANNQVVIGSSTYTGGILLDTTTTVNGSIHILDFIQLTPTASPPGSAAEGMIYMDTDHHLYVHNGTTWVQLDN